MKNKELEFYYIVDSNQNFLELSQEGDLLFSLKDSVEVISELRLISMEDVKNTLDMLYRELIEGNLKTYDVSFPLKSVRYRMVFERLEID